MATKSEYVPRGTSKGLRAWTEVEETFLTNQPTLPSRAGAERIPDADHPATEAWLFVWKCERTAKGIRRTRTMDVVKFEAGQVDEGLTRYMREHRPCIVIAGEVEGYANYRGEAQAIDLRR